MASLTTFLALREKNLQLGIKSIVGGNLSQL
jgi:hypothetical protein